LPVPNFIRPLRVFVALALAGGAAAGLQAEGAAGPATADPGAVSESGLILPERIFPILQPMLDTAGRRSPQAVKASADWLIAEELVATARARMLPNVAGGTTYSLAQEKRFGRPDFEAAEKLAYNFGLTQPIYHWGTLKAGHEFGRISAQIAERNFGEACRLLLLEVRQAYLRLVVLNAGRQRMRAALGLVEEDLKVSEDRVAKGSLAPGELFPLKLRVDETRIGLERAEADFAFAKLALERLAGIEPLREADIPALVPNVPYDPATLTAMLEHFVSANAVIDEHRVATTRMQLEQERINERVAARALRPKFNVVTGLTQDEVSYTGSQADRAEIRSFYAGVNITWTLFDGFSSRAQRRAALLRIRQLESEIETRMREHVERVRHLRRLVDFAARETALAEARLASFDGLVAFQEQEVARGNLSRREATNTALGRDDTLLRTMGLRVEYLARLNEFLSLLGRDPAVARTLSTRP
jgi:outer membrane protein TolC